MVKKEWTLMFYFASDNPLTPSVVTQLKALKQAGFHPEVNVVAHFDPQVEDTPNHIFDVNLLNKLKSPGEAHIGFGGNDPYVRTLMEDKLWGEEMNRDGKDTIKHLLQLSLKDKGVTYAAPTPPPETVVKGPKVPGTLGNQPAKELGPKESLANFLAFCSKEYEAKHYMLFILGHGIIVGNDIFLFDEHVDSDQHSLSLVDLGEVLNDFAQDIRNQGAEFELVSFHSCSVSSLEVAHELQFAQGGTFKGTANYIVASQGPAFVGSWPYREIVIRVLNDVKDLKDKGTEIDVKQMLVKIFQYIMHNSSDFLMAGYSFQGTLCDLNKVSGVTSPLKNLSDQLIKGLADPIVRNLIVLAHWRSISYWQENYTDLYDFCVCLINLCKEYQNIPGATSGVDTIVTACGKLLDQLPAGKEGDDDQLIVRSDFAGPTYQYSHGLSVFFPWSRPPHDFMSKYHEYKFAATSWDKFLEKYFKETQRETRKNEEDVFRKKHGIPLLTQTPAEQLEEDIASICFNNEGPLNALNERLAGGKTDARDPTGDECSCGSIKNYPHDTRPRRPLPLGPNSFNIF